MARLFTSGWETSSTDSGYEWSTVASVASTSTNIVRSGDRAGAITSLTSGTRKGWAVQFQTSLTSGPFWVKFWLRVDTLPSAANTIFAWIAGANTSSVSVNDGQFRLNSDGTLGLFADDAQVGSSSAALDLGRWHELSMWYDNSPASGSKVIRGYLDGVEFAGTNTSTNIGGTANGVALGGNLRSETQTTAGWYFDDAAVNDSSGSDQTGMPPTGRVVVMRPNGAGDSNDWNNTANAAGSSSNYQLVDENPPNDATDMVQTGTANALDLYAMESSGAAVPDTVNVVHVHVRRRNNIADATTSCAVVVRKTAAGTQAQGATTVPNTTTWRTGGPNTSSTVIEPNYTAYLDPDGAAWTQATLDSMQAGVKLVTAGTNRIQVSGVWATADYTPAPARRLYLSADSADYTPATVRGAWDDTTLSSTVKKLSYTPAGASTTSQRTEGSATADYDVLLGRWVSGPATTAGALAGHLHWVIGVAESGTAANMVFHWHLYVTAGDSDTVRGTLRADYIGSTEWPLSTVTGRNGTNISLTSVDVEVGDRLVLEIGYRAENTVTDTYTGTLRYGGTGLSDLTANSTNVTTQPGWIELTGAVDIFDPDVVPGGDDTASPAAAATTTTLPSATATAGSSASPAATATAASLPAASASVSAVASPAAVSTATAAPDVQAQAGATPAPAAALSATTLPAATVTAAASVTPTTAGAATALPAATPTAGSAPAPAPVDSATALPAATATAGATAAPAALASTVSLPTPQAGAAVTITPAAAGTTATLPAAAASAAAQRTPATLGSATVLPAASAAAHAAAAPQPAATAVTVPPGAVSAAATAQPAPTATTATVPQAEATAGSTTTPTTAATAATVPAPQVTAGGSATAQPAPTTSTTALPSALTQAGATATPAVLTTGSVVPAAGTSAAAATTPATLTTVAALPAAAPAAGATTAAAAVGATTAVPAVTVTAGGSGTAQPAPVSTATTVPQPTRSAGASTTPTTVGTAAAAPAVNPTAGGRPTPAAINTTAGLPQTTPTAGSTTQPAAAGTTTSLPGPTARGGASTHPAALTLVSVIPTPTVTAGAGATANPQPVAALSSVLAAAVSAGTSARPASVATTATIPTALVTTPGRIIHPPDDGTITRPTAGTITRPSAGTIYQP